MGKNKTFTAEEEKMIQQMVKASKDKERQMMIEAEIRNRMLTEQSKQPGYKYY